jgi:hypothetical protein
LAVHTCCPVQVPQFALRGVPQLSFALSTSQFLPRREQKAALVSAMQPHIPGVPPPPQVCGALQLPQLDTVRITPQLSAPVNGPHVLPRREQNAVLDSPVQPHTPGVTPPPQVCGAVQPEHATPIPQLLITLPHLAPFWHV